MICFAQENTVLIKDIQELKLSYESILHIKNQLSVQYDDLRRQCEDEQRVIN